MAVGIILDENQLQQMLSDAVSPLMHEIATLKKLLKPHQVEFDDYEAGYKVAVRVTGFAESTIRRMVSQSQIPSSKIGGKRYFSPTELKLWLAKGRRKILTEMV